VPPLEFAAALRENGAEARVEVLRPGESVDLG
jgi:hypothetical protein